MTDDSSDDRMDRAQRIREMREGSRPDDSPETDASDDEAVDAGTPDGDTSEGESATAESSTGEADDGDPGPGSPSDDPEDAADWFDEADGTGPGSGVDGAGDGSSDGRAGTNGSGGGGSDGDSSDAGGSDVDEESPFGDGMPQMPGMDIDDASVDADVLAQQAGLETDVEGESPAGGATATGLASSGAGASAETQSAGGGDDDAGGAVGMAGSRSGGAVTGATTEDETRVLEFALAEERYCLDIEYVEEIVKRDTVTRVPNTPEYVAGVVDLRGQITTILDPKVIFDIDTEGSEELIVVFDPDGFDDQGAIGWLVDDVNQVMPVADSEVNPSPVDQDHVEGVVDRDGEFVIWTTPERAVENATG